MRVEKRVGKGDEIVLFFSPDGQVFYMTCFLNFILKMRDFFVIVCSNIHVTFLCNICIGNVKIFPVQADNSSEIRTVNDIRSGNVTKHAAFVP